MIFTAGVLMLATPRCWSLSVIPVIWALIGGSALLLGVYADAALPMAGVALAIFSVRRTTPEQLRAVGPNFVRQPALNDLDVDEMRSVEFVVIAKQAGLDSCATFRLQEKLQECRRVDDDHAGSRSSRITTAAGVFRVTRFRRRHFCPCSACKTQVAISRRSSCRLRLPSARGRPASPSVARVGGAPTP